MSTPDPSPRAPTSGPPMLPGVVADLRRTVPETRAVLAGLVLVLGAWVGPGLPDTPRSSVALSGTSPVSAPQPTRVQSEADDTYLDAVGPAPVEEEGKAGEKPRKTDDDQE